MFAEYRKQYPELAAQFENAARTQCDKDIQKYLPEFDVDTPLATRKAFGKILNETMPHFPMILGGSADLTPSNNTRFSTAEDFTRDNRTGRYLRYGTRELAMAAIMNGIATSNILRPYSGTFMVFSDYMRAGIRVAAISDYPSIFVFTHDSIGLGEDGPTHQPVEHLASMRAMPNLMVWRPADANETSYVWKYILQHGDPACICLSRQSLPVINREKYAPASNAEKGAYAIRPSNDPDVLLLATGSEVAVALAGAEALEKKGIEAQVVSMPCWEAFEMQDQDYKDTVLPPSVKARVAIEAAASLGWSKYIGAEGNFLGLSTYGRSGPGKACFVKFGITPENVQKLAENAIKKA
jgi:transketolase